MAHSEKLPLKSDHNKAAGAFTRKAIAATHGALCMFTLLRMLTEVTLTVQGRNGGSVQDYQLFLSSALSGQTISLMSANSRAVKLQCSHIDKCTLEV